MQPLVAGAQLGSYRIVRQIGAGGMGAVYEAVHEGIERRAAIKVLHATYARDADLIARFFNEAKAANRIEHPGLVQIYDFGQLPDGDAYLVMELLRGETLGSRLRRHGQLSFTDVSRIGLQAADALAAAHAKAIVHRDLKPDNLMLVPDPVSPGGERVKVLDFGIAKLSSGNEASSPTLSQVVMGTPRYMAPEQCRSASAAFAPADVYALGTILYEALAGRPPFESSEPGELLAMHLRDLPPELSSLAPAAPGELAELIMRMLAKAPKERPVMVAVMAVLGAVRGSSDIPPTVIPIPTMEKVPVASRSTLGRALGESLRADKRSAARRWPMFAAGVLGLSTVCTGLVFRYRRVGPPPAPSMLVNPAPSPLAPDPKPEPLTTPAAQAPPPSREVEWFLASEPPGAGVYDAGGTLLGKTPWRTRRLAASGQVALQIRRRGYSTVELRLDTDADETRRVTLQRQAASPPREAPSDEIPLPRALLNKNTRLDPGRPRMNENLPLPKNLRLEKPAK